MALPTGLTIDRSVGPVTHPNAPDLVWGCAITRTALPIPIINPLKYWGSDFICGPEQDPEEFTAHWGPFDTEAEARENIDAMLLDELDENGTDGASLWLTLP